MVDQPKEKKRKVLPPTAPSAKMSKLSSSAKPSGHARGRSLSNISREDTPPSGKYVRLRPTYPTPESATRRGVPRAKSSDPSLNRVLAPDFDLTSTPRPASQTVVDVDDSDDAMIIERNREEVLVALMTYHSQLRASPENQEEEIGRSNGFRRRRHSDAAGSGSEGSEPEDSGLDEHPLPKISRSSSKSSVAQAGPSVKKTFSKVKDEEQVEDKEVVTRYNRAVCMAHTRRVVLDACKLNQAQDAGKLIPQFDESHRPVHFVDGVLIPHLSETFAVEWAVWGDQILKMVKDRARTDPDLASVLSATDKQIRDAVKDGVFSTMKTVWKKFQSGQGEAWLKGRRSTSTHAGRKSHKAENRMTALKASGLDVKSFGFVADPNYQSDEEDDPVVKNHRNVRVAEHRSEECIKFMIALDIAFDDNKSHPGNQKCIGRSYYKVNTEVPKLQLGCVPQWAVSRSWEIANPGLELISRRRIERQRTEIPQLTEFQAFIHRYALSEERVYLPAPSTATPAAAPPPTATLEPEPAGTGTFGEDGPFTEPFSADATQLVVTPLLPAPMHIPTPGPIAHPDSIDLQYPGSVGTSVEHHASVTPTPSEPQAATPSSAAFHQPNFETKARGPLGVNSNPAAGPQSATVPLASGPTGFQQPPYTPNVPTQPIYVQVAEGQWIWVMPCYPPPTSGSYPPAQMTSAYGQAGGQSAGPGVANPDIPIDPNLQSEPIQFHQQPNDMPPPPVITSPTPELPPPESTLTVKLRGGKASGRGSRGGRGKGGRGSRGGRGTGSRGRPRKSKVVIEESDEDAEGGLGEIGEDTEVLPIAGSSHQPPNVGKVKKVNFIVRGE
ncbi:unnamed protein product [Rhizoctonia solani]|uniref:Uncharacterized protein n=1 Tax=Rhizoctonia solani TaxID=456999 RepID=A0A8H3C3A9_9AGAM|nr:unnamed protein product [Rhizoctonia solani]CAE6473147.1 unnamed protein product [Rhizoctonia solani]